MKYIRYINDRTENKVLSPYIFMLILYLVLTAVAFFVDSPAQIIQGIYKISTSRSILITDYIELGGIGATLINSVFVGLFSLVILLATKIKPNGATVMGLFLSTGFAFFGKNVFNMLPITFGVWLYSKTMKQPFKNFYLAGILSATLSPIVSELTFYEGISQPYGAILGVASGILVGFIFPPLASALVKAHSGFNLYNMGFAGGMIATFFVCVLKSLDFEIESERLWGSGNNLLLAVMLYTLSAALLLCGYLYGGTEGKWKGLRSITKHSGRLVTDYYITYGNSTYINMGILCALGTSVILVLGGDLNGPTMGAIFTMTGFGAFGKHIKNVTPILIGAIICTYINTWDPREPLNMLAILFSTTLAPIAGQFGWRWGIVTGILHVTIANFAGLLNGGLNLYNNGFAGGIVAMFIVPLIMVFKKDAGGTSEL